MFVEIYRSRVTFSYLCSEVHESIFKRTPFPSQVVGGRVSFVVILRFVPWDLGLLQIWRNIQLQSWLS